MYSQEHVTVKVWLLPNKGAGSIPTAKSEKLFGWKTKAFSTLAM